MTANTRHLGIHIYIYLHSTYLRKHLKKMGHFSHTYSECLRNSRRVHITGLPVTASPLMECLTYVHRKSNGCDVINSLEKCLSFNQIPFWVSININVTFSGNSTFSYSSYRSTIVIPCLF